MIETGHSFSVLFYNVLPKIFLQEYTPNILSTFWNSTAELRQ